jgi:hypothetical protein
MILGDRIRQQSWEKNVMTVFLLLIVVVLGCLGIESRTDAVAVHGRSEAPNRYRISRTNCNCVARVDTCGGQLANDCRHSHIPVIRSGSGGRFANKCWSRWISRRNFPCFGSLRNRGEKNYRILDAVWALLSHIVRSTGQQAGMV